jgi:hypothetical protein
MVAEIVALLEKVLLALLDGGLIGLHPVHGR